MPFISLTSDFGRLEPWPAMLRTLVQQRLPDRQVVDVSHDILPFRLSQAAYVLRQALPTFPEGSVHIVLVNLFDRPVPRLLLLQQENGAFVLPDNGIHSLLSGRSPEAMGEIGTYEGGLRHMFDLLDRWMTAWQETGNLTSGTRPCQGLEEKLPLQPVVEGLRVRATIIHIDRFGNAVLNVDRTLFERIGAGRPFRIRYRPHESISRLCRHPGEVDEGQPLLHINSAGFLEIAVRIGHAATLLHLNIEDNVLIEFENP